VGFTAVLVRRWYRVVLVAGAGVLGLLIGLSTVRDPRVGLLVALLVAGSIVLACLLFKDNRLSIQRVVVPLMVVSILLPAIPLPGGVPDLRLEVVLIFVIWGLLVLGHLATGQPVKFYANPIYKWFALFGLAILLSMSYASSVRGYPLVGRDFWELVKLVEYFLIFALVANLDISRETLRRYYKIALLVLLCSALFGFAQRLNLWGVNAVISPHYAPTQMRNIIANKRITGTTRNPNEMGALMVLASSLALSGALFFRRRRLRLFSWVCLSVFGLATILTISRSALIALVIAMCFILFIRYPLALPSRRSLQNLLVIIPVLAVVSVLLLRLAPEEFFVRVAELGDVASASSWYVRVEMWESNLEIWKQSPLLGWGPGKATMGTIVDNEWILVLRRYGLVGLVIFISLFASLYLGLSRIRRRSPAVEVVVLTVALEGTLVAYAVYMTVAAVYHLLQLMPILLLFLGLAYSQGRSKSRARTEGSGQ